MIERRIRYTQVPHKDPALSIVLRTEVVFDDALEGLGVRSTGVGQHVIVTSEFMRDVDDSLAVVAHLIET